MHHALAADQCDSEVGRLPAVRGALDIAHAVERDGGGDIQHHGLQTRLIGGLEARPERVAVQRDVQTGVERFFAGRRTQHLRHTMLGQKAAKRRRQMRIANAQAGGASWVALRLLTQGMHGLDLRPFVQKRDAQPHRMRLCISAPCSVSAE